MTIQSYENNPQVEFAQTYQDVAIQRLGEWANSAQAAHSIATTLVQTSFCPDSFRNKPGEATAAILAGMEVGLQPMAALRSFDVIQGQAAPRAVTLRAIVQSHGHELILEESTATRCRIRARRRGSSEWQTVTWTIDRARDLGLVNKSNWKSQPQAMLVARATSEAARLIAADAILGLPYSAEEIADGGASDQQVAADTTAPSQAPATRRMSRKPSAPDEAPIEPAPEVEPVQTSGAESPLLTNKTKFGRAFYARMGERDFPSDQARIEYVVETIGRFVTSTKEITEAEAKQVLDRLDEEAGVTEGEVVES